MAQPMAMQARVSRVARIALEGKARDTKGEVAAKAHNVNRAERANLGNAARNAANGDLLAKGGFHRRQE